MERVAASILQHAVEKDLKEQYTMALALYEEGFKVLVDTIKEIEDPVRKKHFETKAAKYLERAEYLKALIEERKSTGKYREHIKIESGAIGYGYGSVFGRFLDNTVTQIRIEEPHIRTFNQCQNLLRFCELAVFKCQSLSKISLITTSDPNDKNAQIAKLEEIKKSLASKLVTLDVRFSDKLHDKEITLSNGWVIKIGRGLDYFRPPEGKFVLGYWDLDLRPCHETIIDIFHKMDNINP